MKFKEVGTRKFKVTLTENEAAVLRILIGMSASGGSKEEGIHELYGKLEDANLPIKNYKGEGYISVRLRDVERSD